MPSGLTSSGATGSKYPFSSSSHLYGDVDILTPYMDQLPHSILCDMYADIYAHDPVSGAVVDMLSNLPFSDFELRMPVEDPNEKLRQVFEENIDRLRVNTLFPAAIRERMVYGAYTSLLVYNSENRVFTDTIPFEFKHTQIQSNILYGGEPTIIVSLANNQKQYLDSIYRYQHKDRTDPLKDRISPKLLELLRAGTFELDALSSLYFPNKPFTTTDMGTSVYRRILPIYLLEKVMLRGTIHMANRRQNSIVHIQAGGDEWDPTPTELQDLVDKVIEADRDPIGAAIATRQDVNIADIGSPGGFWRWNDMADELNSKKLLALGVSESFLCLAGDTLISTERGLQRIDSIADTSKLEKDQCIDIELSVKGMHGFFVNAIKLWYRGESDTCIIYTESDYSVTCTPDHKILIMDEQGFRWVKAKDLTPDDYLLADATKHDMPHEFIIPARFVRRIESEKQRVYDLSIEEGQAPAFVANGLIVHNSGDAAWSTLDHALTVFIEQMRALRRQACNQFFYNKLFPLISILHDFKSENYGTSISDKKDSKDKKNDKKNGKDKKAKEESNLYNHRGNQQQQRRWSNEIEYDMSYRGDLVIPIIEWEKKLIPGGDSDRLDMMDRLAEKGVPFSLRTWAAAGGFSLDQLTREMENSTSLEKKIQEVKKAREKGIGATTETRGRILTD